MLPPQLAPLLDHADFDGAALLSNDPFDGVRIDGGKITLTDRPGIGAVPAKASAKMASGGSR